MQQVSVNGILKTADMIAKGPHVFNEATRKYEERPVLFNPFPRVMFHESMSECLASSLDHQTILESEGWQTKPFPAKIAKETVTAAPVDLASIILRQQEEMRLMHEQLQKLTNAAPDEPKRGPGRPPKQEEVKA